MKKKNSLIETISKRHLCHCMNMFKAGSGILTVRDSAGHELDTSFADNASLLLSDQHQRGTAAQTDQLLPEVEEALFQTEGPNSLLRQRRQGKLQLSNRLRVAKMASD